MMLTQEINLYRAFETPQTAANFLTWKRFWFSQLLFLLLSCLVYSYTYLNIQYLISNNAVLNSKIKILNDKLNVSKKHFPAFFFTEDVSKSVESLQQELEIQKRLLQSLASSTPFSTCLAALSTVIIPDVWLTTITITDNGGTINLKGKSTNIVLLQKYFDGIQKAKFFANFDLDIGEISQQDKNISVFELELKNKLL